MPYIKAARREPVLVGANLSSAGELNFLLTTTMLRMEADQGALKNALVQIGLEAVRQRVETVGKMGYDDVINHVMGAFLAAYLEYRRRRRKVLVAVPLAWEELYLSRASGFLAYERTKIEENGDCYPPGTPL